MPGGVPAPLTCDTTLIVAALLLCGTHGNPLMAASGSHGNGGNNCSAVFEQGLAWVLWRGSGPGAKPAPGAPYCVIQQFDKSLAEECLERRRDRSLRPFEAYFIGDSRTRDLYTHASSLLNSDGDLEERKSECLERFNRTFEPGERRTGRDHWCSYNETGRLVSMTYLWRQYLDDGYLSSIRQLARQCQLTKCPDLVLVNGGMHVLWKYFGNSTVLGIQRFGRQLKQLAPLLQQLAEPGVTVVWLLNEPLMEDAAGSFTRMHTEVVWLLNQVAVTILQRYRSVVIWTSHLPVALWYQEVCRVLDYPHQYNFICNDPVHLGQFAYVNYLDIMMNHVCDGYVSMPESNCCGRHR